VTSEKRRSASEASVADEQSRMCPLRYIVFAVSALVALLVLVYGGPSGEEEQQQQLKAKLGEGAEGEAAQGAPQQAQPAASRKTSVVDLFTGRYLMRMWAQYCAAAA
jgi:hypothetical protein